MITTGSRRGRSSRRCRPRRASTATPEPTLLSGEGRSLQVAIDIRALAGGPATGIGRYIQALLTAFSGAERLAIRRYAAADPPLLGPQLLEPLRMRGDHAQLIHGPANVLPLMRFGLPGVVTIHDLAIYDHPEWFPPGQWFATRVAVPQSIRRATAIIAPSIATLKAIVRLFGVDVARCRVIPHGVEPAFALPASERVSRDVRQKYGLPTRYLLQVGTIQPRKNYLTTLRAMARIPVPERIPLVAIGNAGWGDERIVETVSRLQLHDWVRFVGYAPLDDLPALYQLADGAVFPSLDEGFGLPVLEAFAAGVPLAASNAGAIPEVAGDAALLSDPHDDEALAANLQRILGDASLRGRLVAAGRARAQRYSWAASAAAHRAVYEAVVR